MSTRLAKWMATLTTSILIVGFQSAQQQATISKGQLSVTVNEQGLIVGMGEEGLRTFGGPEVQLTDKTSEWFGLSFNRQATSIHAVGEGDRADWADRTVVQPVSFSSTPDTVDSITRVDDVEIHTHFYFDRTEPYLLAWATLTNVGDSTVRDVYYTREWSSPTETWSVPVDTTPPQPLGSGIQRMCWMWGEVEPGGTVGVGLSFVLPKDMPGGGGPAPEGGLDVPLALWTSPSWPAGLNAGITAGISFGDYNADGFPDMFVFTNGRLFLNAAGLDWILSTDISATLPFAGWRHGSAFGDYNNDGLPDIAGEPYGCCGGDPCHHLYKNLGLGTFQNVATDLSIMDVQGCGLSESAIWGDVDGDGNLDLFIPYYPPFVYGGPGNFFWHNNGPGVGGEYTFTEMVVASGLDNPPGTARPEGAMYHDTDSDGDAEIYSNGTMYENVSVPGTPLFNPMTTIGSGIKYRNVLEEGIVFHDIDMDGDLDFTGLWTDGTIGVRVFEALGDGVFLELPSSVLDAHTTGITWGISTEDWDNDGDMDLTTQQVFRRNQYMETGTVKFTVANHSIDPSHVSFAIPSWADWDKDGDLDCMVSNPTSTAVGNSYFYENTLYGEFTSLPLRRYVRVRVMRDSATVAAGLETEYGATAEIHIAGETDTRRVKLVSCAAGYINQNEYVLHFAVPADPAPFLPDVDISFDVTVNLVGPPQDGFLRIDKHVNPVLGDIKLAQLEDREITVFRSGKVLIDGCTYDPVVSRSIVHGTSSDGLIRAQPTTTILGMTTSAPDRYVGIEFDTLGASGPIRITELLVDGQLDAAVACAEPTNIALWDVTNVLSPVLVGSLDASTRPNNRRTYIRTNMVVEPGRIFRLVARVTEQRASPIAGPVTTGGITVTGGLSFPEAAPCLGGLIGFISVDPASAYIAFRFNEDTIQPFTNYGGGNPGTSGTPALSGTGPLTPGTLATVNVSNALPGAAATLAVGLSSDCSTFQGTAILPSLDVVIPGFTIDGGGNLSVGANWPDFPPGTTVYFQVAVADPGASGGAAITNGLAGTTQP